MHHETENHYAILIPMPTLIKRTTQVSKAIANVLTPLLGTISLAHIKNSGDLINKLKSLNVTSNDSLDIKSQHANIPIIK